MITYPVAPGERQPSRRMIEAAAAFGRTGSRKEAAAELGVSTHRLVNLLSDLYRRLGAASIVDAWRILGWLRVPPADEIDGALTAAQLAAELRATATLADAAAARLEAL